MNVDAELVLSELIDKLPDDPSPKVAIFGGPFTGKTTAHKAGDVFDPEMTEWWDSVKADEESGKITKHDRNRLYVNMFHGLLESDLDRLVGHWNVEAAKLAWRFGRRVFYVLPPGPEMQRRVAESKDLERASYAVWQYGDFIRGWLSDPWLRANVKVVESYSKAV